MVEQSSVQSTRSGAVHTICINRPESLNALNPDVLQGVLNELSAVSSDQSVRVVVMRGSGPKAFVAGADIRSMSQFGPRAIADYLELGQRTMRAIESLAVPVIAAVHGFALGGGLELALACDLIVCSASAKLGQPEVSLGIIPGFGGTQRLIHRCGVGQARRLCYSGELIAAEEARVIGLADRVFPDESFDAEVIAMAELIGSKAPLAVQGVKRVIHRSQETSLLSGLRHEVEEFLTLFSTADREEGMEAFIQKRKPNFTGR